jgi:hypothetical protein
MLADAEEQLGGGLVAKIGEIGAVERGVWREVRKGLASFLSLHVSTDENWGSGRIIPCAGE